MERRGSLTVTARIGPKMRAAALYVALHAGCTKMQVADQVGASRRYGYDVVNRAIAANLIAANYLPRCGKYELYVTTAGVESYQDGEL
jgi:hypothetical protein